MAWLSVFDPLEHIDEACRGARLSISFVGRYGCRAQSAPIGRFTKQRTGASIANGRDWGLGVFPLDVRACHIDALAADGHKWLLGPEGCGVLYISEELQERVEPVEFGWTNVAAYNDYASRDMTAAQRCRRTLQDKAP